MAPTTPVLDDFNRANGGLGANWSTLATRLGFSAPRIVSNACTAVSGGGSSAALWTAARFGADQEAYLTIGSADGEIGLWVRCDGATTSVNGYAMTLAHDDDMRMYKWVNGSPTQIGTVARAWARGDAYMMVASGSTIAVYRKPSGSAWDSSPTLSVTDRTFSAGGYVGLYAEDATIVIDDFGGGTTGTGATIAHYDGTSWTDRPLYVYDGTSWTQAAGLTVAT